MSMHDKTLFFFDKKELAAAGGTSITSKVIDMRYNGDDIDGHLFINAVLGKTPSAGSVTLKLQTSEDGSAWSDVCSYNSVGEVLYKGRLPLGLKRYLRCVATVKTALDSANTVFAEITDCIDTDLDQKKIQRWKGIPASGTVPEGMEDLAKAGDAVVNPTA